MSFGVLYLVFDKALNAREGFIERTHQTLGILRRNVQLGRDLAVAHSVNAAPNNNFIFDFRIP